jgi:hypothetical protein
MGEAFVLQTLSAVLGLGSWTAELAPYKKNRIGIQLRRQNMLLTEGGAPGLCSLVSETRWGSYPDVVAGEQKRRRK